jgi:WW domain-containing oxidoreductase
LSLSRFPLEERSFKPLVAYGQAKLCNVLFANELTRRYEHAGIYASSLHPAAFISTSISRESRLTQLFFLAARPFTKTIAQGAATSVYCATSPALERVGGRYYRDCAEARMSAGAADPRAAEQLWKLSEARVRSAAERAQLGESVRAG